MSCAQVRGTPQLLMELALGKAKACLFLDEAIRALKRDTTEVLEKGGFGMSRTSEELLVVGRMVRRMREDMNDQADC